MKEFKFICPSCQQKIEVEITASGRQFACPGCRSELIVPQPPQQSGSIPAAILAEVKKQPSGTEPPSIKPGEPTRVTLATSETADAPRLQVKQPEPTATLPRAPAVRVAAKPTESPAHAEGSSMPAKQGISIKIAGPEQVAGGRAIKLEAVQPTQAAPTRPAPSFREEAALGKDKPVASGAEEPDTTASVEPPAPETPLSQEKPVQIADLTPAIKRDMVRSIRRRLANEAHWMPGFTTEGKYAYAAKEVEGKPVLVEATSPEATRFSILGASLAELQLRSVTRTASGRMEFLDQELLEAIREAAGEAVAEQEARPGEDSTPSSPVSLITHAQSLKALDLLEERYTREVEDPAGSARARPEDLRLAHLTRKLERKESVAVEELCVALANELGEINQRLVALERSGGQDG